MKTKHIVVWIATLFLLWIIDCMIRVLSEEVYEIYKSLIVCAFYWFLTDKAADWVFDDKNKKDNT